MYPFGWIVSIYNIADNEVLRMVGLDAYMFLRVQKLLFKTSLFFTLCGLIILLPTYATGTNKLQYWGKYTIANVESNSDVLWVTTIVMYMFAFLVCRLFYEEYNEFFRRRIHHYISGDPELPKQANYTIMLENVPIGIRSVTKLKALFEKLFPDEVYCVEVCLDLRELESLCARRISVRNQLEKAVAISNAYDVPHTVNLKKEYFKKFEEQNTHPIPKPIGKSSFWGLFGYGLYDAVDVFAMELDYLNKTVLDQQKLFYNKLVELGDVKEPEAENDDIEKQIQADLEEERQNLNPLNAIRNISLTPQTSPGKVDQLSNGLEVTESILRRPSHEQNLLHNDTFIEIATEAESVFKSSMNKVEEVEKNIIKELKIEEKYLGNTIGLFIPGTKVYMKFTGTAFITFKSRFTKVLCERALLSHRYFQMRATAAPNPKEIVWSNITAHSKVQKFRGFLTSWILAIGAVGWAALAYVVSTLSQGLNSFASQKGMKWIQEAQQILIVRILFQYLFLLLLLLLMALLPLFFDAISRRYEGVKTETLIHESIMFRYFCYQLVYVLSTTGLSALTTANGCLGSNCQVTNLIGSTLPTVSSFFVTLLVFKAFIQMPVCLIRGWPLLRIATVKFCCLFNRKKVTRREIRNGIFFDPPMLYGWYYPSILMVALILFVFSTIAPLLSPVACIFFVFTYTIYKHHLLYVYVDFYQAGGSMFTSVFNQIMTSLLIAIICLLCYYTIQSSDNVNSQVTKHRLPSAFYGLLPILPCLLFFWHYIYSKFNEACVHESLQVALEVDNKVKKWKAGGQNTPHDYFRKNMYRQRCLTEDAVRAEGYRSRLDSVRISDMKNVRISEIDSSKEYFDKDERKSDAMSDAEKKARAEEKWFEEVDYFDKEAEDLIHLEIDELLQGEGTTALLKLKTVGDKVRNTMNFVRKKSIDQESSNSPLHKKV